MLFDCSPAWVTQPPASCSTSERVEAGPLDQPALGGAEDLGRVQAGQAAIALADRGPDRFDDDGVAHD